MNSNDRPAPPVTTLAPAETPGVANDVLTPAHSDPPVLAEPEALAEALRYLQQRIPGFTHLSVQEKRSYSRAANLDPEFVEHGLHAATAWRDTMLYVGRSAGELLQEREDIRQWDQAIVEMRALTDGMEAANTKRKHRLGTAILIIYRTLGYHFQARWEKDVYMRPYYENMKRAYLRTRQFRRKKKQEEPEKE